MSLRTKVLSLLLAVLAVYAAVDYVVQRQVIFPRFVDLEREEAIRNLERALQAIRRELTLMEPSCADWARWDDTYQFVQDRAQFLKDRGRAYIDDNLNAEALAGLRIDLMAFYHLAGQRAVGLAIDQVSGSALDPNAFLPEILPAGHPLLTSVSATEPVSGILDTASGPMLFVSHPILTSKGEGPARGNVIMGRRLDAAAIARIADQTRIQLRVTPPDPIIGDGLPIQPTAADAIAHTPLRITTGTSLLTASTSVLDLTGQAVLGLMADLPREITARGEEALRLANLSMGLAGGLALILMLLLLRHTVFRPVSRLTAHAMAMGTDGDLSARLDLNQTDEIGTLAREFDKMVARLAETRQQLLERSYQAGIAYQSGIAEMASGVLHNIGNAITPLGVKLTKLKRELQQAPLEEIARARHELADPATPSARRADLVQFLELAREELVTIIQHLSQELPVARTQVDHVESILTDQRRFSRAAPVLDVLALDQLLAETVRLLPDHLQAVAQVEIDPRLVNLGRVSGSRVALAQVINNLLINAAESIRASGKKADTGRIRIRLVEDPGDDPASVHLCFDDNGQGIAPDDLPRLFQRGFSTKERGSGLGLHWSANVISAMGGRLCAESAGVGQGACLHLYLSMADQGSPARRNHA